MHEAWTRVSPSTGRFLWGTRVQKRRPAPAWTSARHVRRTNRDVSGRVAFDNRSFGDCPVFHIVPERNEQFAGQRDNPNASQSTTATAELAPIPRHQGAGWLIPDPAPGELHHEAAHVLVAGARDALIVRALAAL